MKTNFKIQILGLMLISSIGHTATECPGLQQGVMATATTFNYPAVFSDCDIIGGGTNYLNIINLTGLIIIGTNPSTELTPTPGPPVHTGNGGPATIDQFGVQDMGPSFPGNCTTVVGTDPTSVPAVSGNYYCGIFDATSGDKTWIRTQWDGTKFINSTIANDSTMLPVSLESYSVD